MCWTLATLYKDGYMVNKGMEGGQEIARVRGESKGRMAEYIIDATTAAAQPPPTPRAEHRAHYDNSILW